jgi:hypothetical protein
MIPFLHTMVKTTAKRLLSAVLFWLVYMPVDGSEPFLSFSHERGFYYASFELILTASTEGCSILYTLDGSDPRNTEASQEGTSPVTLLISPYSHDGRGITPGIVVRACVLCYNDTGRVETHTYIFPSEIKSQPDISDDLLPYWPDQEYEPCTYSPNLLGWMQSDYQQIDLGIDPEVVAKDEYYPSFEATMLDIPTLSLVTDPGSLFDSDTGIYINSTWQGIDWERTGSIEHISAVEDGFQFNTGIRIRGGYSSSGVCTKHAFRLFFRNEYGDGKLDYPLFAEEGADEFDKIDLRCDQNNSWHIPYRNSYADFVHDIFSRDIQGNMQQPYTRSVYYHLFVNGMYWGLYETQERPEASYAETYFGGDKEDYDVIKSSGPSYDYEPYTLEATDGNLDAARALWEVAKQGFTAANYNRVRGLNPDGSRNPEYEILLDEENLIDYMIIIYYSSNRDGPGELNGGIRINNFFGIYNREEPDGFKFFIHDNETAFGGVNDDITNTPTRAGENFTGFNPAWLHQKLMENTEYRQKFADRAYHHLFGKGVLTPENTTVGFQSRADQIDQAIIGESARWGDIPGVTARPFTKLETWMPVIENYVSDYFPQRTDVVINQFRNRGWFNALQPPEFDTTEFIRNEAGLQIAKGGTFSLLNPNGTGEIYYTLNDIDPRASGGNISGDAILYAGEITAMHNLFIKARIKQGDEWSPLAEKVLTLSGPVDLKITEISYNPGTQIAGKDTLASQDLEFIEIKNCSAEPVDISGFAFIKGIRYKFPLNSIMQPDSFTVIASDSECFASLYGFATYGQFDGNLNNKGEDIILAWPSGNEILHVAYNADGIWYDATDGSGFTLVFSNNSNSQLISRKDDWRVSANRLGSPGKEDPSPTGEKVIINEVLANSDAPLTDAIEIFNPADSAVNIGNWYLSDEKDNPGKWRIPEGTTLPAKGYVVFYEGHYSNDTLRSYSNEFGEAFSISAGGEQIFLYSSTADGKINNFIHEYAVNATESNTSFGNYSNSLGEIKRVQLEPFSPGAANEEAKKSPLILKTILYHPAENDVEFLVLKNRTDSLIRLYSESDTSVTWHIDGIGFDFPGMIEIAPGDSLYLVEKRIPARVFANTRHLDEGIRVFNYDGQLKNSSEILSIQKPIPVLKDTGVFFAYATLESVEYTDDLPWPTLADGDGYALQRKDEEAFADDARNWSVLFCVNPIAISGLDHRVRVKQKTMLDGSGSYDPQGKSLSHQWRIISKPVGSQIALEQTKTSPAVTPDLTGNYTFSLEVDNGEVKSAPSLVSILALENRPPLAFTSRSSYKGPVNAALEISGSRSYDPDYDPLGYSWEIINRPDGSIAEINQDNLETLLFTPDMVGRYDINLIVNDGDLYSTPYKVAVTANASTEFIDETTLSGIQVYPNPTRSEITLELFLEKRAEALLSVTDMHGHVVVNQNITHPGGGAYVMKLNFKSLNLMEGIYFLRIQSTEFAAVRKIIYIP